MSDNQDKQIELPEILTIMYAQIAEELDTLDGPSSENTAKLSEIRKSLCLCSIEATKCLFTVAEKKVHLAKFKELNDRISLCAKQLYQSIPE